MKIALDKIAGQLGCSINTSTMIHGVSINSRERQNDCLFVAIKGDRFDGHDFVQEAINNGAVAILSERYNEQVAHIPQLIVPSTLDALTQLALFYRQTVTCPVIALTGSNGKTTVKEMIANCLPKPSFATRGNFNNHIGVPLSIFQLLPEHRYAVFELGANHLHEIAHTVSLVKPQVALINNIGPAHIEGFGSIEGVAKAKGEIYQGLSNDGIAIVNQDDDFAHFWDDLLKDKQVIRFSMNKPTEITAKDISFNDRNCATFILLTPKGQIPIQLQVPGEHSVRNALAAAACCYASQIDLQDIAQGLNTFQGVAGRMTFLPGKNGSLVIDDTYNANLRSVLTAINVLAQRKGQRMLVLGDLGELGQWTQQHHEEIGHAAKSQGLDLLWTCGKHSEFSSLAFGSKAQHYTNKEQLVRDLLPILSEDITVLVKGSRSAAMEKIVQALVLS